MDRTCRVLGDLHVKMGGIDEKGEDAIVENTLKAAESIVLTCRFRDCTSEAGSHTKQGWRTTQGMIQCDRRQEAPTVQFIIQ